jgi:hypothetical protein
MMYFTVGGQAAAGAMPGEDAVAFQLAGVVAQQVTDGASRMLDFGTSKANAVHAVTIIKRYGFTHQWFVGRPNAPMMYFRKESSRVVIILGPCPRRAGINALLAARHPAIFPSDGDGSLNRHPSQAFGRRSLKRRAPTHRTPEAAPLPHTCSRVFNFGKSGLKLRIVCGQDRNVFPPGTLGETLAAPAPALPPTMATRWSPRRKAEVVLAARNGNISREEAYRRYLLSPEELAAWEAALDRSGIPGLRSTRQQSYRLALLGKGAARREKRGARRGRPRGPGI